MMNKMETEDKIFKGLTGLEHFVYVLIPNNVENDFRATWFLSDKKEVEERLRKQNLTDGTLLIFPDKEFKIVNKIKSELVCLSSW
jgi:hypothetical protein